MKPNFSHNNPQSTIHLMIQCLYVKRSLEKYQHLDRKKIQVKTSLSDNIQIFIYNIHDKHFSPLNSVLISRYKTPIRSKKQARKKIITLVVLSSSLLYILCENLSSLLFCYNVINGNLRRRWIGNIFWTTYIDIHISSCIFSFCVCSIISLFFT